MVHERKVLLRGGGWITVRGNFNMMELNDIERILAASLADALNAYSKEIQVMVLKAGTIVHVGGFPVELVRDTEGLTHPGNVALIEESLAMAEKAQKRSDEGAGDEASGATD